MLRLPMRPPGTFKLHGRARRSSLGGYAPHLAYATRADRIVDSLRSQILDSEEEQSLRVRQVFEEPKEIFRIEIERPEQRYQRTTLLDREALEDLLATDDVRERFVAGARRPSAANTKPRTGPEEDRLVPGAGLEPARPSARRF